ncbi:unnamed protein product [Brassica rapa subsp. narinosa]
MRGGIQICYPHVILYCGSLDQHRFAREKIWMNQKKNHLHAVSWLKAVNEEEDQGKKSRKKLGCWVHFRDYFFCLLFTRYNFH